MAQKMSKKKKASAAIAGVLAAVIAVGGAYAWVDYSQSARNTFNIGVSANVLLHDDFNGQNKDVYVENTGESDVYVRVKFAEYLQIGNNSILPAYGEDTAAVGYERADVKDVTTWPVHRFNSVNSEDNLCIGNAAGSHTYYEWKMTGAQKDYLAGVTEADSNGRGGLTKEEFDTLDYGVDFNLGTIKTHKNSTEAAAPVMMLSEYLGLSTTEQDDLLGCWLLDTDGWAYWSKALKPDTATNLLLDEVVLSEDSTPYDNWEYNIDVQLQAASVNELDNWYADGTQVEVANPDNSIATTTLNGYNFVNLKAGNYIVGTDSLVTGANGTLYISLGGNVYREAQASGEGYVGVEGTEVVAGQDKIVGTDDDNMLSGRSAAWGGEVEIEISSIDLVNRTYTIKGASDDFVVTAGIDKIMGTYDDVITSKTGALGTYDIDGGTDGGDDDKESIGWNYLGGPLDKMLVATEYVLDNVSFDDSISDLNNDYSQSKLKTKIDTIGDAFGISTDIVPEITLSMTEDLSKYNYIHVCTKTAHTQDTDHGTDCTYSPAKYYTSNDGQDDITGVRFFALSLDEMLTAYGDGADSDVRSLRIVQGAPKWLDTNPTSPHSSVNQNNNINWKDGDGNVISTTNYWLRSPGFSGSRSSSISVLGYVYAYGSSNLSYMGARPACYMNLAS